MDIHQKISIGIFGSLLLGTLAMYGAGWLSSSALKSDALWDTSNPCSWASMTEYAKTYPSDKEKMIEIQRFIGRNCSWDIAEAKKSYCDARAKQLETYSALVKKYETCLNTVPTQQVKTEATR